MSFFCRSCAPDGLYTYRLTPSTPLEDARTPLAMVQASSSLLWSRSSGRKHANNGDGQQLDEPHRSGRTARSIGSVTEEAPYGQSPDANGPSPPDAAQKRESGLIIMQAVGQSRKVRC